MFWLLLTIFVGLAMCQNATLRCQTSDNNETWTRGQYIPICLHFIDAVDQTAQRIAFEVKIDQYTALEARNVYDKLYITNKRNYNMAVQASKDTIQSPHIPYIVDKKIFPITSLVIRLDGGNVSEIIWDNGCWSGPDKCWEYQTPLYIDSNNYIDPCPTFEEYYECDPKIYVSFIGSDVDGTFMESAGMRISRFRQYSVSEIYFSARSAFKSYTNNTS